jgi:xylan 1,4-beta-xylosidase
VVALWNLVDPEHQGAVQKLRLEFRGVPANHQVLITRLDEHSGNTLAAYERMGEPQYPTQAQILQLNAASQLSPPEKRSLEEDPIVLELPPNALVILEIPK